jgi:hypothetical protein
MAAGASGTGGRHYGGRAGASEEPAGSRPGSGHRPGPS